MSTIYRELIERIRGTLADLEIIIARAQKSWAKAEKMSGDQDTYLDSVALNLHSFYSAIERLFESTTTPLRVVVDFSIDCTDQV